ncbi:acyl-CoA dehydrogenase C-terminal domain-containing protein, partial [Oleiphilus sp. HI0066]|uniref:acyl-CoA dehydrogenase C-terminal domain-containing protein n=1 Tax=Oleiphilus sp. HI0066 TaxID=1822242 RepID=UPI000B1D0B08
QSYEANFYIKPEAIGAAAVEYLDLFGLTAYGYMWARMVAKAAPKVEEDVFYANKLKTANFFFSRLLPRTLSLLETIKSGSEDTMALEAENF